MVDRRLYCAVGALMVAGCGGGGSDAGSPPPTSAPAPAPAPAPSPTPTPTPVSYPKVTDRSVSFTLSGVGARIIGSADVSGNSGPYQVETNDDGRSSTVSHMAMTDSYRGTYGIESIEGVPTRTQVGDVAYVSYMITNVLDAYQILTFARDAEYSQLFAFGRPGATSQYVFPMIFYGAETIATDLPSQATDNYSGRSECSVRLDTSAACSTSVLLGASAPRTPASISTDWSGGTVKATTTVSRNLVPNATYQYTVSVDARVDRATGRIRGTASASALGQIEYTGSVVGQFYGPQAREAGMIVALTRSSTGSVMLVAIGARR